MLKFIHAADLHLDSPFRSLPSEQAALRRQGQRELLDRLMALCEEEQTDFLLLAGDVFDGQRVYPETVEALCAALGRTAMPVLISPGNHDFLHSASPYLTAKFPNNVHIFTTAELSAYELEGAVVYGHAFTAATSQNHPLAGFAAPEDGRFHIGLVHGDLNAPQSVYSPVLRDEIAASGLDYLGLGHVHQPSTPAQAGRTTYAYAGCPEGRGFDECGDRGCYVVTLEQGEPAGVEFAPLAAYRYFEQTVQGGEDADWEGLASRCFGGMTDRDALRIVFTGEVAENRPDLTALQGKFGPLAGSLILRDATVPAQNLWARMEEDSLTGLFLREMRRRWDEPLTHTGDFSPEALAEITASHRETLTLALRYGMAALEGREEPSL